MEWLVFESPVWSGFLTPKGVNRNHNQSTFVPEVKKTDRTAIKMQTAVLTSL
ncbi:hypothetical protein M413DRAFT_70118 [Hebeloma cylindrosporum]|uniref:Uncharacterized protein n=1 Tax=Hebeloma cylindrosporum TaxID=76867 RepID=A0A0C3CE94_HEBCY|nr:hypothetical protein M413DRAFT_70118 [Hebeloma cylindrosporum h7]